jgi:plasmid stabilization system protein ParE
LNLELTRAADADLTEIWIDNVDRYSIEHADKYHAFLLERMDRLTEYPALGRPAANFPNLRYLVIKRRASGHGHAAYYEVHPDVIRVVRVLHTAMNPPDHIKSI